LSSLLVI